MYKLNFDERRRAKETCAEVLEAMNIKFSSKDLEQFDIIDLDLTDMSFLFLKVISANHPEISKEEKHINALWAVQGFIQLITDYDSTGEDYEVRIYPSNLFANWLRISEQKGNRAGTDRESVHSRGSNDWEGASIVDIRTRKLS